LITVIAGGTGSVKLIRGLTSHVRDVVVIANTGDNIWLHGLYICPDIDIVLYGLADLLDRKQGWGIKNDSFGFIQQLEMLGEQVWFKLGDRDVATHLVRTNMFKGGKSISQITEWMRNRFGVATKVIPATDSPAETRIKTDRGEMHIQEFWVKNQGQPKVIDVVYTGAERSRINPEVVRALRESEMIIIAPANPITSIGPILALKGAKEELILEKKKIIAVSPFIGTKPISGPAGKYMDAMKMENSPFGVTLYYSKFLSAFIISRDDNSLSEKINNLGIKVYETDIIMNDSNDEKRLASYLLAKFTGL